MHTKHWSLVGSAPTSLTARVGVRIHTRRRWPALLAALALSAPAALSAETAYQEHIQQKQRYLSDIENFNQDRRVLGARLSQDRFSAREELNDREQRVAMVLSNQVRAYFTNNRANSRFGPMRPFHEVKGEIAGTRAYQFLTNMPKGALLHAHLSAIGRMDWVVSKALTLPNCYVKWPSNAADRGHLLFLTPEAAAAKTDYSLVAKKVAEFEAHGLDSFSNALHAALSFDRDNTGPGKKPWAEFDRLRTLTGDFIRERSVFTNYLLDAFQALWNDGVYYVELRDSPGKLKTLNREDGSEENYLNNIRNARTMMQAKHKEFDCRLVLATFRGYTPEQIVTNMQQALELRGLHDDLIGGFDLIGEESGAPDRTTHSKVADVQRKIANDPRCRQLADKLRSDDGKDLPYFLHDGESAWADNDNLVDAISLATPRIGHAFNLYLFPSLYPEIRAKDIALEICPISNQLLGLAPDLRTHPAAGYLNAGLQCVLASDDPLWFGNDGLSYDFWEALIAWNLGLADLKKLARNSITYCGLDPGAKARLMEHWTREWDKFIDQMVEGKPEN